VRSTIEEAGFTYAPPSFVPNSFRSLQLGELARVRGRLDELHPRLFAAYWSESRDIGDWDTIVSLGSSAGLDPGEVRRVIEEGTYRDRIEASTRLAVGLGADGVRAWLIDGETLMVGAQPVEVFERVMARVGRQPDRAAPPA
jgi:predicted DsbA family dithiol-disulfide isomerase